MISGLKPYAEMKGSGVEWLGAVPAHWDARRLKALLTERGQKGFPDEPLLTATQSKGVVRKDQYENRTVLAMKDLHLLKLVCVGDFVISLRSFQGGIEFARERGIISPAYTVLYSKQPQTHAYLAWLFKSAPFIQGLSLFVTGIRQGQNIDYEKLSRTKVPLPPADEQTAIVRFLDHADRRIRRAIAAKQKLIRLLEEQKRAIIHHAVTRGLDPDVRLKPSGIEWLGDVPEHWEVNQVRSIAQVVRGSSPRPAGSPLYFHGDAMPWITVGEVTRARGKYVTETSTCLTAAGAEHSRLIEPGTFLLTNSGATLGIPKISGIQGCINDGVAALLKVRSRVRKEFLLYYFTTQTVHLKAWVDLGAQPNLNTQIIGGWPVPIPTIEEQVEIVSHIERGTESLAELAEKARSEILAFREYRTRLIADVVTGKFDVRGASAGLPAMIEPEDCEFDADAENEVESMEEVAAEDQAA